MLRGFGIAVVLLYVPTLARAQDAPEDLLPAGTQLYVRWDGIDAHRPAYEKTALGKMLQGDTGKFVTAVFNQLQDTLGGSLTVQQLLVGAAPDRLQKIQADATEAPKLLGVLGRDGFVLGVEVRGLEPPDGQVTLILPNAGAKPAPFFSTLRLVAAVAQAEVKETKIADRAVSHLMAGPVQVAWWVEGKHAVLVASTESPQLAVKRMTGKGERLTANPLFQKVKGFDKFETGARAFVDVAALVKIAKTRGEEVTKVIDGLGLDGLQSLTFHSGFDGVAERSLIEWNMPGPRKGILRLLNKKTFTLADVPPLPADVVSWSMTNFDPGIFYDVGVQTAENVVRLVAPDEAGQVKEFIDKADTALGINIRKDLLEALGDQIVVYNSPAEGPLTLGQTFLIKVKNADKLQEGLDQAVKGLTQATGAEISVKKKKYRGVDLREVHVRQQGFIFVPSYAIYKDWLVIGYFPHSVQGFILRAATDEVPVWKPGPRVRASLDKLPKEFISISVSDPRPSVNQLLSIGPIIGQTVNSFAPDIKFDVGSLPNAHEATRHLFPNVTVVSDDGKTLRFETRASLALPFDLAGLDSYGVVIFATVFGRFAVLDK